MSKSFKGDTRTKIVERRWKARKIWQGITLPDHVQVRNNPDGTPRDEPMEVCLGATRELLERIGNKIFVRNFQRHYLAISADNPSRVSYASTVEHKFDNHRRMKTTLQRYVARNFADEQEVMVERGLEMFIEKFKAKSLTELDNLDGCFSVVSGQQLKRMFSQHYGDSSCMTGSGSVYVNMYRDNPDVCRLLLYDDGNYKARAMLFNTNEGATVCDRVYPNSGSHIEKFNLYCDRKGYDLRDFMGYPSSEYDGEDMPSVNFKSGDSYSITVKVPWNSDDHDARMMPYMDSFHWGHYVMEDQGLMVCYNHPIQYPDVKFMFDSTTGRLGTFSVHVCACCDERVCPSDLRRYDGTEYCEECFREEFQNCDRCDCYARRDDFTEVNRTSIGDTVYWCETCTNCYSTDCSVCGEQYRTRDMTEHVANDGSTTECCEECCNELDERKENEAI